MTKYERRRFFERLVQLRALYRLRGNDDSVAGLANSLIHITPVTGLRLTLVRTMA